MPRRFDFISPGVSIREVDESTVPTPTADDGILLIGHAPQGPANVPIKINNLEDFYRVFGKPVSGKGSNSTDVWRDGNQQATTYAMYAAQAWLASGTSPVTFVRTLGQDQLASKQATGYVPAGWNSGQEIHATTAASNANALGLFIMPSASSGTTSGTLAAIIYTTGSNWALSGTIGADPAASTTAALNTPIRSSTTGQPSTFTLVHSSSTVDEKYVVHFDRKEQDGYIRNVLNCNPQKTKAINYAATAETYFLGETFDEPVTRLAGTTAGEQFGMLVPLTDGTVHYSNRELEAQASKTGYFINRNPSPTANFGSYTKSTHEKLFRLCSLHEGEWFGKNYGVRIENIRVGSTANPTSTFSVVIVDSAGNEVEQFDNLNLNESSANFIGKMIGDQYQEWNDTLDKYMLKGEYSNRSDYVRVEMANDWKSGIADERMVPFGVWGPTKPNTLTISSGSATAGTNVIAKRVDDATMHFGHAALTATFFANMKADLTCSLAFPDLKLTDENSNNSGNYTKDYVFGVRHMLDADNQPKKSLWYSPDYKDLVRALPSGLNIHEDGTKTQISWIFSLDDIREEAGTNSTKFYYENGSHAAGNSFTGNSGSAKLITQGVRQFNAAFFGGSDGLDIRQVDPFSVVNGLASGQNENKHYAYHSVKRVFDVIADKDLMSYDIVSMPGLINSNLTQDLITIAEDRADTLAIIDLDGGYRKPYEANGVEALGTSTAAIAKAETLDYDTSYAATYYPPVRLRDTTSGTEDVTVVPPSVAAIGAIAKSEATSQGPWFAPAGFNRGGIGVLGGSAGPRVAGTLEHLTKKDRDDLYEQNINPIARFPSIGEIVIFGQKTLQQSPSALDRINVRRLMIFLKKRIGNVADTILFDQNVNTTWLRFKTQADAILSDVKSRFGLTEYKLVLDETTTTADLVDRNIMYAKIFVKPARAIEFIAIDFVITRSGVEF
tara:strand:- start:3891 stop:6746 length:2856 start_codon:yes stop_codon:yes gene_type:complete